MSVKLLLNPVAEAKECIHPETGVRFMIRPITPEKHEEVRRASLNKERMLDTGKWGANYAVAAIADWDEQIGDANGPLPCTEENLRTFGRNQAFNIIPWIIEQATGLDQYRVDEVTAAKNA